MAITTMHPAAATITALVAPHTDQVIERTRLNGFETGAGAGNTAQTAMTPGEVHPQSRLSLRSNLSGFSVFLR